MIERSRIEPEPVRTRSCFDDPKPALFRVRCWNGAAAPVFDRKYTDWLRARSDFDWYASRVRRGEATAAQWSDRGFLLERAERK